MQILFVFVLVLGLCLLISIPVVIREIKAARAARRRSKLAKWTD